MDHQIFNLAISATRALGTPALPQAPRPSAAPSASTSFEEAVPTPANPPTVSAPVQVVPAATEVNCGGGLHNSNLDNSSLYLNSLGPLSLSNRSFTTMAPPCKRRVPLHLLHNYNNAPTHRNRNSKRRQGRRHQPHPSRLW